jgi:hypothetical protein
MSAKLPAPARPGRADAETERCGFCLQTYVYEVQVRCADCDLPMCPFCVVRARAGRVTCRDCGPDEDEGGEGTPRGAEPARAESAGAGG